MYSPSAVQLAATALASPLLNTATKSATVLRMASRSGCRSSGAAAPTAG